MKSIVIGNAKQEENLRKRQLQIGMTKDLMNEGLSTTEIAVKLGISESTVRSYKNVIEQARTNGYNK